MIVWWSPLAQEMVLAELANAELVNAELVNAGKDPIGIKVCL